jgi:hypothetical protein
MQEADHLTIELFLTNEEQVDYLKNHTPPRLRPASWKDVDELSPSDQSELLHMATMLQEFEIHPRKKTCWLFKSGSRCLHTSCT